ncbi:hypothetical protein [Dyadobacter sp. NIV53]|uniref:hypothetical protein n=1 Tax=Dyadobacter sp. NIV53 TaxID=2861765 RepID=UPI001C848753|nr:hypothetical protein [Dyadobacter sp. NIV53]
MKIIRLCYRKIIDADSPKLWDKAVFDATHLEFYMQAQRLDPEGKFKTFQELLEGAPNAGQLHYLTSTAAVGYIRQLKDIVPDIANAYGKLCLPFKNFKFEIIDSHILDKTQYKVAIYFYTEPVIWIDTVYNQLLISYETAMENVLSGKEIETDLIPLVPHLSISNFLTTGFQS